MNLLPAKTKLSAIFSVIAVALLSPVLSWGWGCTGHEVVALIALDQMDAATRAQVDRVLAPIPRNYPGRFCSDANLPALAYFATWADDYRTKHPETAEWHYWDIPLEDSRAQAGEYCEQGCVVQAIRDQLVVMKDQTKPQEERLNALLFVIHFIGDVHQPLHAEDNLDRGGNCVPIGFLDKPTAPRLHEGQLTANYSPNLHSIWDTDIVEHVGSVTTRNQASIEAFANYLSHRYSAKMKSWKKQSDPVQWALESHQVARDVVYRRLPTPISPVHYTQPVKDCGAGDATAVYLAKHEVAGPRYIHDTRGTAERRLTAAGARLAELLTSNWPPDWK